MSQNTPRLDLPLIQPAQAQKHVTHNSAIEILDAITQLNVVERDAISPPTSPADGDCYALGSGPTGDWASQDDMLAVRSNGGWLFIAPLEGWRMWDANAEELCIRKNGAWSLATGDLQNIDGLGIQTSSDANNRLAVSSPATLLTHDGAGGGHQLKVNKAAATDTASLLFQTGYSGRAEMGTTGSDDFAIKVSADGSTFVTAMSFDAASGIATGDAIQQTPSDVTAGRLMRADYGYSRGNILGTVAEAAGLPTGAVFQSGQTSDGDYIRYADGTQVCFINLILANDDSVASLEEVWNFPVPFSSKPSAVSGSINANSFLSNSTPKLDEIGAVMHSNTTSSSAKILLYRLAGMTDFAVTDTTSCRVSAIGRWF